MAILITTRILQASLVIVALAVFSPVAQASTGDQQIQIPSDSELRELLNKANEKVTKVEATVNAVKPLLDKNDSLTPKRSANYLDTAAAAHSTH